MTSCSISCAGGIWAEAGVGLELAEDVVFASSIHAADDEAGGLGSGEEGRGEV